MAEKKKKNNKYKPQQEAAAPKADKKKILVVILVIAVVVAISLFVDYSIKNPRINELGEASNRILGAGVIATHPEIDYETPTQIEDLPMEEIGGQKYWPVEVTLYYDSPEAKVLPLYYVAQSNGKIYTMGEDGKMVPYGV